MKIGVVDYGMGNLHSVLRKLRMIKVDYGLIETEEDISNFEKIILPGVGHFGKAMKNLEDRNLVEALNKFALEEKKPILGICLGMQLMTDFSEEGNEKGLGWVSGKVKKFQIKNTLRFKVPHTGWNKISIAKEDPLMTGLNDQSEFYFVHSFHFETEKDSLILNKTNFEREFVSAFSQENIFGVQYHPEKSFEAGTKLFSNFASL